RELLGRKVARHALARELDEEPRAGDVHAEARQVSSAADDDPTALGDEAPRADGADPRHAEQSRIRRAQHVDRKLLGMREPPLRLRIPVERKVAVATEHELGGVEAVLSQHVLGLIQPRLAGGRRPRYPLHRRSADWLERTEVRMVEHPLPLETPHEAEDL